MNVLVTGGAGYIGSHTAKALAQAGHVPVVLDNLSRGHRQNVKWGPFIEANCGDETAVSTAIRQHRIDAVVHFAAYIAVGESMQKPRLYFANNTAQTLHLLNAMLENGVRRIVFSSTAAVYGDPIRIPIDEEHPLQPVNVYGETKLFVERILHWLGLTENLRWVALRYFNAAGADPDGEFGEDHEPETHLIPRVILSAQGKARLDVFGTDYPTVDGTAVRDYVHVADLADAHVRALTYLQDGGPSMPMNLGTGSGFTVRQVIEAVESAAAAKTSPFYGPRREGDPVELIANPDRARRTLGWNCRFSDLKTIVETAWRWQTRNGNSS